MDDPVPALYEELRRIAARHMAAERPGHTLQPTALVHEAWAKLEPLGVAWRDRTQYLMAASQAMRRVLVDHARARRAEKRGGDAVRVTLDEAAAAGRPVEILEVDEALSALERRDPRKARVVELHFFGGLSHPEIAEALGISEATVDRDLRFARAWLRSALAGEIPDAR